MHRLTVNLTPEDYLALDDHLRRSEPSMREPPWPRLSVPFGLILLAVLLSVRRAHSLTTFAHALLATWPFWVTGVVLLVLDPLIARKHERSVLNKRLSALIQQSDLAAREVEVNQEGIRTTQSGRATFTSWALISHVDMTADHVFLRSGLAEVVIVPARALASQEAFQQFKAAVSSFRQQPEA